MIAALATPAAAATKYPMKPVVITTVPGEEKSTAAELLLYRRQSRGSSDAQRVCGRRVGIRVEDSEAPTVQLDVAKKDHLSDRTIYGHRQR